VKSRKLCEAHRGFLSACAGQAYESLPLQVRNLLARRPVAFPVASPDLRLVSRLSCEKTSGFPLTPLSGSEMEGRPAPWSISSPSRAIR
jgi:hypothetical protein